MVSTGVRQRIRDINFYLILIIFISTLGPLQFGFHLSELNAPRDILTCKQRSVAEDLRSRPYANLPQCIAMNEAEFASLSSIFVVGGLIGAVSSSPASASYGRLLLMRITSLLFILGSTLETLAGTVPIMSIGRFLAGAGAGASTVVVPLYISEVAPPKERGFFGSMTQVMIGVDVEVILGVGACIGLAQGIGLYFVPESPAWLAVHRNHHRAIQTLQRIRGHENSIEEEIRDWDGYRSAEEEPLLRDPQTTLSRRESIGSETSTKSLQLVGFFAVVRDPLYQPAIVAVIGIMFAHQFCGINSISMYSVSLLSGFLPITSSLLILIVSFINIITTMACAPLPDIIGRKPCLLLSIAGMGFMSLCLALSLRWEIKILSAISVLLYVAFFSTGLGPVPFMMASELVGQEAVGATQSWGLATSYVANFIVARFFPIINTMLNDKLGGSGWVYFIFAGLAVMSFLFVSWRVPETMGKKDANEVWGRTGHVD
ncbi:hypothetical protein OIDMADRAFT_36611 [Oidiodendron maius Zn]|uniref:Major facilitator superfamily (MFS) profile domain-containing protein n=1 Tax=Oidiodendron maius (strain Zn) TaxID=913774 RepID=A0A0C3HV11_OIDMZ|nr:hypothetical protein OIDMADRAFT_36611 [Oidiodendron maius Zn]